jgi:hypothetical protein
MKTQTNRTWRRASFVGLTILVALTSVISCVSSDDVPGGRRVEHPDPSAPTPIATTNAVSPSVQTETLTPTVDPPPLASVDEPPLGLTRSPLDKAIAEDDPARPWSKSVPKRSCTKDDECGDGFCDRGRCAAIWTSTERYGQRCERDGQCGSRPCIDGRCRSCISDMECEGVRSVQNAKCTPDIVVAEARECSGVVPTIPGTLAPGPLPQKPKQ